MLSKHKYFVYESQSPKTFVETFIVSYKSSLIVFFSTNLVFCIFIFIMWSFIFNYKFFSYNKKTIINYFFIIYLIIIGFMITNFFVYKLIWNDYYFTGSIRLGYMSAGKKFKSFINSYWTINSKTRTMSFFFSILSFLFFNSFIYKMYINKEEWNFNKIYFIPLLMIAQVALTTLLFAKNFIVIYTSIELFSMIIYYIIIFESTNYKTKFNNNIYNTELSLKYFIISLFGSINILIGISFIFYSIGSLNFNTIRLYFVPSAEGLEFFTGTGIKFGFITFIIGLLIKMGIAPYHFWINGIYDRFSNSFFEYMSIFPKSIVICFILNIFSIVTLKYPNDGYLALNDFFTIVGILNIIIGTFSSINQTDMKRIIMYSSLANIGYIFITIGANYESFSVAYSYIIHYTIALFILFRVLNHIEIDQKISFKQWYFAEFSSLSIKNKIFMTIAIFNISGLPPFAIFFNKFYILTYIWSNGAYISFIVMIIFSVISYSYYFNIIKYIWFNEKYSSFTAYNAFKKNVRFDNMFNSNKTGNDILEYFGWNEPDVEMGEESDPDNFTYDNYAKIVKSTSIYENWVKSFCFEIEKVITRIFIFSTFIGFFSAAYTIAYFKFIKMLDWNVGRVWVRRVWVKRIKMAIQLFISAGGMPRTKQNNLEAIKAGHLRGYYKSYINKFDYFTKWVAETMVGDKNRLVIVNSDYYGINKITTPDQGLPILIDSATKIVYMIDKYFISNFTIASFCIIGFYFWLSINGKFKNVFLSLTLFSKTFKTMFQICVAFFIILIINSYNIIMQNYFNKHKIRHYYQMKKYKKYGIFLSSVVVVISFIIAFTSIVVIAIEIVNFISIPNLFIAMIFLNFYLKLIGITPEHDWNFENIVRTTLSVKKLFRDFFYDSWAKDNPKYSWFARLRTRRPWFNPNRIIKIKKKNEKNGTSN